MNSELCKVRMPSRVFKFSARIWFPWHWVIRRHQDSDVSIIPTVITDQVPMQPRGSAGVCYIVGSGWWTGGGGGVFSLCFLFFTDLLQRTEAPLLQGDHAVSILALVHLRQTYVGMDAECCLLALGR